MMLEFREINITDKERVTAALQRSDFMGCEYSFANNMAWRRLAGSKIAFYKDFYICGAFDTDDDTPHFVFPAGSTDYVDVIAELKRFTEHLGRPLVLTGVTERGLGILTELFPGQFTVSPDRDSSDYIYYASDLIALPGRKYHAKRNHLANFNKHSYSFEPITDTIIDECILFCTDTYNGKQNNDHSFIVEQFALNTYFNYFDELGLSGAVIRNDERIIALTIGEKLNSETFCVHIEKADTSYSGIYAAINNCFAKSAAADFRYINREEDMGIEGLRKSKLSYHPAFLLMKNIVTFR